jgi:ribosomal-protein-alanine N-acetyltransferase
MKETFEITALRMAKMVLDGPRKGWLNDIRGLAKMLTGECEPALPCQPATNVPRPPNPIKYAVHIRWMIRRDMPEVLEIESHSFEFCWDEETFIRELRQRNCIGMICEFEERVIGFMVYQLHKDRLHILNFAVHQDFRWGGVGRQMIDKLKSKISPQRRNRLLLECRESNTSAQCFFKEVGFRAIAVIKGFYEECDDDAYLMQFVCPKPSTVGPS